MLEVLTIFRKAWLLIFLHTEQWGCNDVLPGANLFVRIKMQLKLLQKLLHQSYAMRFIIISLLRLVSRFAELFISSLLMLWFGTSRIICLYEILAATILSSLVLRTNFHSGVVLLDSWIVCQTATCNHTNCLCDATVEYWLVLPQQFCATLMHQTMSFHSVIAYTFVIFVWSSFLYSTIFFFWRLCMLIFLWKVFYA